MNLSSLDQISKRCLLERSKPIHWYAEYLFHASTCLRELTFDTLKIINTKILTVNDYFAVDLPSDFSDEVMVGVPAGGRIQPVPQMTGLNPIRSVDANFGFVPYTSNVDTNGGATYGFVPGAMWFWNMNEYGEPTGRYFGAGGGAKANGYQVFRERGEIQLTETFTSETVILMYISDGQSSDNATQIDTRAFATINAFIIWKSSPNRDNDMSPEGRQFSKQKRRLRALLDDLTAVDIKNIIRKNQMGAPKS